MPNVQNINYWNFRWRRANAKLDVLLWKAWNGSASMRCVQLDGLSLQPVARGQERPQDPPVLAELLKCLNEFYLLLRLRAPLKTADSSVFIAESEAWAPARRSRSGGWSCPCGPRTLNVGRLRWAEAVRSGPGDQVFLPFCHCWGGRVRGSKILNYALNSKWRNLSFLSRFF